MYLCTWAHAQNHCTMEGLPRLGRCRIYEGEVFGRSGGRAGNVLLDLKISWCRGCGSELRLRLEPTSIPEEGHKAKVFATRPR